MLEETEEACCVDVWTGLRFITSWYHTSSLQGTSVHHFGYFMQVLVFVEHTLRSVHLQTTNPFAWTIELGEWTEYI